jgi:hypothetical protein
MRNKLLVFHNEGHANLIGMRVQNSCSNRAHELGILYPIHEQEKKCGYYIFNIINIILRK